MMDRCDSENESSFTTTIWYVRSSPERCECTDSQVQQKYPGTTALLGILRNGEPLEISVTLSHLPEMVKSTKAEEPRYVCWAGLGTSHASPRAN